MAKLTATGESRVIAEGFTAYRSIDQSEGRGGEAPIASFSTLEEALAASRRQGVQGDDGSVSSYEVLHYTGGAVVTVQKSLIARRQTPEGSYTVGWLDLREYEYGVRPGSLGPVRRPSNSIFSQEIYAVPEADSSSIAPISTDELRSRFSTDPTAVGVWRRAGEDRWRGEFPALTGWNSGGYLPQR